MTRGIIGLVVGLFLAILVFSLLAWPIVPPVVDTVTEDETVQDGGYVDTIDNMERVLMQWAPIIVIGGLLLATTRWVLRRERLTGQVRRR